MVTEIELDHYAVDFETYWDDEVKIQSMGAWRYLRDPKCDIYMVSIIGQDVDFVGDPKDAPWDKIAGEFWVSHNAAFDGLVFERLVELGVCEPEHSPKDWQCTANMSVYIGAPRDLKGASKALLKVAVDKEMRYWMKGKNWADAVEGGKADELLAYARNDSINCWRLWSEHSYKWPDNERELGLITTQMCWHGLYIDQEQIKKDIKHLKNLMWEADQDIPWAGEIDEKGKETPRLSPPRLAEECRKEGIPAPVSVAQDSPECEEWLDKYGEEYPWIMALRTWRRCNALRRKLETMLLRVRPDGRMPYGLKYFGAHTGRWSGDSGWNPQNLHREELFGIHIRTRIIPAPGKKFIIADLSQIEPRIQAWITQDWDFLELCKKVSIYEAHARKYMNWVGGVLKKEALNIYQLAKARILALGYGAGFIKFITMAKQYNADACFDAPVKEEDVDKFVEWLHHVGNTEWIDLWDNATDSMKQTYVNSWLIVMEFRRSNKRNPDLWEDLNSAFQRSIKDGVYELVLPSGRVLTYRKISCAGGSWTAQTGLSSSTRRKFYGGKLTENLVQATARDVFAECTLNLWRKGYQVVLSVHDELVIECDMNVTTKEIEEIMAQPVKWLPGCPIACEAVETNQYCK